MRTWDRLSATFVKGLKRPGKFFDGGGLMLQATATKVKGTVTKAWLFRYQLDLRARQMGLGSARVVSLGEARLRANECRKLLAAGIDPIAHRDARRMAARAVELHTATFRQVLDQLLDSHGDRWRQKHARQYRNSMEAYCKPLMAAAVGDIDTAMVVKIIEPEWKRAPETLDRVRRRIGEVLGFAEVRGFRKPGPLPTRWTNHLDKLLPHPRSLAPVRHHAAMTYEAVPVLFKKLVATDSVPELCLAFLVLTASRSGEARGARWDEIDFKAKIWTVPPSRMKRAREHRVPLSAEAMKLIERLPRSGEYLFSINGNGKPIVAMSLRKALHRHGGAAVTVHGFRSAFRVWADESTNYPRELKEVALSHAIGNQTEAAYARGDLLERRRELMAAWARHCAAPAAGGGEKVVALRVAAVPRLLPDRDYLAKADAKAPALLRRRGPVPCVLGFYRDAKPRGGFSTTVTWPDRAGMRAALVLRGKVGAEGEPLDAVARFISRVLVITHWGREARKLGDAAAERQARAARDRLIARPPSAAPGAVNIRAGNEDRDAKRRAEWAQWQAVADGIGSRHPDWKIYAVALRIAKALGLSGEAAKRKADVIRKRIKNTWSDA